jgi:cell division protease FtsH
MTLPTEDRFTLTKEKAEALISFMMGGRVAEELIFGHLTTGASNDIERASDLARKMVTEWGMSERLGPQHFGSGRSENPFLGRDMGHSAHLSEDTSRAIDEEVKHIIQANYTRAKQVVSDNLPILKAMSEA